MPWSEKSVMEKKLSFIRDYQSGAYTKAGLSRKYNISRKTVYKYLERYETQGEQGLEEQSRAPKTSPHKTPEETVEEIIDLKIEHMSWGPKKLIARLSKDKPETRYPSPSTAQLLLKSYGLVKSRKHRHRVPPRTEPFSQSNASNDVWSIDYKGQYKMGNGSYCYPLTLQDSYSRYILLCIALSGTLYEDTRKWLKLAFQEYGLPLAIRSDNGVPFAAPSLTGLSRLSIWLIQLGISLERIDKGHPEQNGRLERMHRTLKESLVGKPGYDLHKQQELLTAFKDEYNILRPHEAINFQCPAEYYVSSPRPYPSHIKGPEYASGLEVRKVQHAGEISYGWKSFYICQLLAGEYVGVVVKDDKVMDVYYYDQLIASVDVNLGHVQGVKRRESRMECLSRQSRYQPYKKKLLKQELFRSRQASTGITPVQTNKTSCQIIDNNNCEKV